MASVFCFFPRFAVGGDIFGRAGDDDLSAVLARLGADVDDPVGRFDHVQIMFDHDDGIAEIDQPIQHVEELGDIGKMQSGRRLIEEVEGLSRVGAEKVRRQV